MVRREGRRAVDGKKRGERGGKKGKEGARRGKRGQEGERGGKKGKEGVDTYTWPHLLVPATQQRRRQPPSVWSDVWPDEQRFSKPCPASMHRIVFPLPNIRCFVWCGCSHTGWTQATTACAIPNSDLDYSTQRNQQLPVSEATELPGCGPRAD
eukprot:351487-Chlamydomonas_euryale.AAC.8